MHVSFGKYVHAGQEQGREKVQLLQTLSFYQLSDFAIANTFR